MHACAYMLVVLKDKKSHPFPFNLDMWQALLMAMKDMYGERVQAEKKVDDYKDQARIGVVVSEMAPQRRDLSRISS